VSRPGHSAGVASSCGHPCTDLCRPRPTRGDSGPASERGPVARSRRRRRDRVVRSGGARHRPARSGHHRRAVRTAVENGRQTTGSPPGSTRHRLARNGTARSEASGCSASHRGRPQRRRPRRLSHSRIRGRRRCRLPGVSAAPAWSPRQVAAGRAARAGVSHAPSPGRTRHVRDRRRGRGRTRLAPASPNGHDPRSRSRPEGRRLLAPRILRRRRPARHHGHGLHPRPTRPASTSDART
jgi:hypothetical protein